MRWLIVIPARIGGQRFPDKVLAMHKGKTLLQYTYEQAKKIPNSKVVIATDNADVFHVASAFDATCIKTTETDNGTQKVAQAFSELLRSLPDLKLVINWQADEPLLPSELVTLACKSFEVIRPGFNVGTLTFQLPFRKCFDENQVKAICTETECLWFTRRPIPAKAHVGLYMFRPNYLQVIAQTTCPAARTQRLEQLAWIAAGHRICNEGFSYHEVPLSINSPEDWETFCKEEYLCQSGS